MNTKKLIIPVLWDHGAERYSWHTSFSTEDELKQWWLQEVNLLDFEQKLRSGKYPEFEENRIFFTKSLKENII